jgi:hypothetical protein
MSDYLKQVYQNGSSVIYKVLCGDAVITEKKLTIYELPYLTYLSLIFSGEAKHIEKLFKYAHKQADSQIEHNIKFTKK